jgi:DNA-binding beta-propeller fold protein YncE
LFVAAANTNNVYAVAVSQSNELRVIEGINVAMQQHQPLGMTPSALALSADRNRLYVACSDANAAAVVDVSADRGYVEGFIPTGWYPTAVRALAEGALWVLNGKGGTASWIPPVSPKQLDEWTKQTLSNSPYRELPRETPSPAPAIQHVIYILKDGAAENAKPNSQKLAREFVTFNHFDIPGEGAESYLWSTAAIVPDYVQRLWPNYAAGRRKVADFEEQDPASIPPAGYLWTSAAIAGVSLRNFGHMVNNRPSPQPGQSQVLSVRDPVLAKVTNLQFRGPDAAYPDAERAKVFLTELGEAEKSGNLARLTFVRSASDAALGTMVEGVSKSRFWNSTVVCVVDAGNHTALLISPFVKRRTTDSAVYNTLSVLRTIELLLGLRPMTHFDAGAKPMTASFQTTADLSPYTAEGTR